MNDSRVECTCTSPLSPMQQGMLFHSVSAPGSGAYLGQVVARLGPDVNVEAFERAWRSAIDRHAVLRTSFEWIGVPEPVQRIHQRVAFSVERHDWRNLDSASQQAWLESDRLREFDLRTAPLMRMSLCRVDDAHLFIWTHHHILLDGRSRALVLKDVDRFYEAYSLNAEPELPVPPSFRDYVEWVSSLDTDATERYWRRFLGTLTSVTPFSIASSKRSQASGGRYRTRTIDLSAAAGQALHRIARDHDVTVSIVVQAAWAVVTSRYAGRRDVVFGVTRSCRRAPFPGVGGVVGTLMNTVPHRLRIRPDSRFVDLLDDLREQHVGVRPHQHAPLLKIHDWSGVPRGVPLFDSVVVLEEHDLGSALQSGGWTLWRNGISRSVNTHYGLTLAGYTKPALALAIGYDRSTFDDEAVARLASHLGAVLGSVTEDPGRPCGDLRMVTGAERQQLLVDWNQTARPARPVTVLPALFEEQVARTPQAPAVAWDHGRVTYAELNERANRLAHVLIAEGIGPEDLVAVALPRSPELITALLGIMKAGAAYLPLDPDYPAERLAFIIDDARPACVLQASDVDLDVPSRLRRLVLDSSDTIAMLAASRTTNPEDADRIAALDGQHPAYVMYTSGSTGTPKGVVIQHHAIVNKVSTLAEYLMLSAATRFAVTSAISFDPLFDQVFCPFCVGGTCVIVPDSIRGDPPLFAAYAQRHGISVLNAVPSLIDRLLRNGGVRLETLLIGADVLPADLVTDLHTAGAARRILNLYGPTETCINASAYDATALPPEGQVPIGSPLPNYQIYIVDAEGEPAPVGVAGELCIGGAGVARGYLRRAALTAERFVPDPYGPPGARTYRTGDSARWRDDGAIEFLGRRDHQVKIRGLRIELGEIENALRQHPAIGGAIVDVFEEAGDKRLIAYVTTARRAEAAPEALRLFLLQKLPTYMVPSGFVALDEFPRTPGGKIDRARLPAPDLTGCWPSEAFVAPGTALEQALADIWAEVLGVERVGIHDNFFELGGHSLSAMQVVSRVRERLQVDLPLQTVFSASRLDALAVNIDHMTARCEAVGSGAQ